MLQMHIIVGIVYIPTISQSCRIPPFPILRTSLDDIAMMRILFSRFPVLDFTCSQSFPSENVLQVQETSVRLPRPDSRDSVPGNVIRNKSICILRRRRHLESPNKKHYWKLPPSSNGWSSIAAPRFF